MKKFFLLLLVLFLVAGFSKVQAAYDSNVGRWLERDPIAERGGLNLYLYVSDDPIDFNDPLGLWKAGFSSYNDASAAGANADLTLTLSIDPSGNGPEASGLVCKKCDSNTDFGYTGPNLGTVGAPKGEDPSHNTTTFSNPFKEPCPKGYVAVGVHYAHPSGRGIPRDDKTRSRNWGLPLTLATPGGGEPDRYTPSPEPTTPRPPQSSK